VDAVAQGLIKTYTFTNVQVNHTISAQFNLPINYCSISGIITNSSSGVGVGGITVNVYDQNRIQILRSGISQSDGSYIIMHPQPTSGNDYVDINCPNTTTWKTTSPAGGWYDNIHLNPGGKCSAIDISFQGLNVTT
jgi:hypothetical protein